MDNPPESKRFHSKAHWQFTNGLAYLAFLMGSFLSVWINLIQPETAWFRRVLVIGMTGIGLWAVLRLRRGRYADIYVVSPVIICSIFAVLIGSLMATRSLSVPVAALVPVIIMSAMWLVGSRTAWFMAVVAIVTLLGVGIYLQLGGTSWPTPKPIAHAVILVFAVMLAALLGLLSESSFSERTALASRLAFEDILTGLPNRRLLTDRLQQALLQSRHGGGAGALLLVDVDDFQLINTAVGLEKGNELLLLIGHRLQTAVGQDTTVARLESDLFAILLTGLDTQPQETVVAVEKVATQVLTAFARNFDLQGTTQHCTATVGIAMFWDDCPPMDTVIQQADLALRRGKSDGRHLFRFFDESWQAIANQRAKMEEGLWQALEAHQFEVHYQPQISGGRLVGAEALLRWRHPERGMVSPAHFIPVAEETGQIIRIGQWVLEDVCRQIKVWEGRCESLNIPISVNVSAKQIWQTDFHQQVLNILKQQNVSPSRIKLELTEGALVNDFDTVNHNVQSLRAAGIKFSLDDFGTGYSSLSYLKRLTFDQIKIDQSFVRNLLEDPGNAIIAGVIVDLARDFGFEVIAEGVETEEQLNFLLSKGCKCFQGYLFAKPMPADELQTYAEEGQQTRLTTA